MHAGGAAKAAGLLEGWLVKAINGKPVTVGREGAANDMLADLVKHSVFKFDFDVAAPAPPREKPAVARLGEHVESGHVPSQAPTSKSPLPATTGAKAKSPKQATKKEAQRTPAAPAGPGQGRGPRGGPPPPRPPPPPCPPPPGRGRLGRGERGGGPPDAVRPQLGYFKPKQGLSHGVPALHPLLHSLLLRAHYVPALLRARNAHVIGLLLLRASSITCPLRDRVT